MLLRILCTVLLHWGTEIRRQVRCKHIMSNPFIPIWVVYPISLNAVSFLFYSTAITFSTTNKVTLSSVMMKLNNFLQQGISVSTLLEHMLYISRYDILIGITDYLCVCVPGVAEQTAAWGNAGFWGASATRLLLPAGAQCLLLQNKTIRQTWQIQRKAERQMVNMSIKFCTEDSGFCLKGNKLQAESWTFHTLFPSSLYLISLTLTKLYYKQIFSSSCLYWYRYDLVLLHSSGQYQGVCSTSPLRLHCPG